MTPLMRARAAAELSRLEDSHRYVLLVADSSATGASASQWTRLCLAQADCVLLTDQYTPPPPLPLLLLQEVEEEAEASTERAEPVVLGHWKQG